MTDKVFDDIVGDFISPSKYVRNITDVLPEGTEMFIGVTIRLEEEDGQMKWKQAGSFVKMQSMGKAKRKPKYTPKQATKMNEDKKVAEEFKQIKITEDEF